MTRGLAAAVRALLAVLAGATLLSGGPAAPNAAAAPQASLGGYQGSAAASGLHALYAPQGLLPTSPPVDFGAPDALATISSGPATFARASAADPGDLLANPDALLSLGSSDWEPGTIPPYPYRATASSGVGAPTAESAPAPGLNARAAADREGSRARATMPALATPAVMTVGSMSAAATTTTDGATVTVHSRSVLDDIDLLGIVVIESIVTDLTASSEGQGTTLTGGTTITGATVAGEPVTIDANGVHPDEGSSDPNPAFDALNELLATAGIRLTVAGPVQQAGTSSGQLASSGLRIDLELSERTLPILATLGDSLPPLDSPIPGAPSIEDVLVAARARHLAAIQLGRGAVSLNAPPPREAVTPVSPPSPSASSSGRVPSVLAPSRPSGEVALEPGRATSSTPEPAGTPATPLGEGIGALALLALLAQPFIGDRIARATGVVLAADQGTTCPLEER